MASDPIVEQVPRRVAGRDPRSLDIDVVEDVVLDAVDGRRSVQEIAARVELDAARVVEVIERLVAMDAVTLAGGEVRVEAVSVEVLVTESPPTSRRPTQVPPAPRAAAEREHLEIDLDEATRRVMDEAYERLDDLDLYDLLGVHPSADRRTVKRAYYAIAPEFHPDRYFRRALGPYQEKMEAIFNRLTFAYDTLTDAERRVSYDAVLRSMGRYDRPMPPQPVASMPPQAPSIPPADGRAAAREASVGAPTPTPTSNVSVRPPAPAAPAAAGSSTSHAKPAAAPKRPAAEAAPPADEKTRRDELLQRLGTLRGNRPGAPLGRPAGAPPAQAAPKPAAPKPAEPKHAEAKHGETKRPEPPKAPPSQTGPTAASPARTPAAKRVEPAASSTQPAAVHARPAPAPKPAPPRMEGPPAVRGFIEQARIAESRGDATAAANFYRLARALAPNDPAIAELAGRASAEAARASAGAQRRLGDAAAAEGRWAEAARAYLKVVAGVPNDAEAHQKAAHAVLQVGHDLPRATELARRAVELDPASLDARLTLAEAYLKSGMRAAARKEAESAREISPGDGRVTDLLSRVA